LNFLEDAKISIEEVYFRIPSQKVSLPKLKLLPSKNSFSDI
jgi:hypothetical protein